jgi:hypothetical protein
MSTFRELHDKAMTLAQLALVAREKGEHDKAEALAVQAYECESKAADTIPIQESSEPTRSILYSSAASLAYQGKKFDIALQLIAKGLCGYPPPQVKEELKTLWEQVNFEEHLQEHDITLAPEDLQISLKGKVVAPGIVFYDEFMKRIQALYSILSRTVQRKMKREYQPSGRPAGIYKYFTPALSVPRPGSFAIKFRLVLPSEYQTMMLFSASEVIDEILTGVECVDKGNTEGLRQLIGEEAYYVNFVSQTRKMAPDGENINRVGLSSIKRNVGLTRIHKDIPIIPKPGIPERAKLQPIKLNGVLDYAKRRGKDIIGLTTDDQRHFSVNVLEGMDDLVRSYFDERVSVSGDYDPIHRRIYLTDIELAKD